MPKPKKSTWQNIKSNAASQWAKLGRGAVNVAKKVDDALVPGKGKMSNIGKDAKKVVKTMKGDY